MKVRTIAMGRAIFALVGPMIWAAHFFGVYLAEAILCSPAVSAGSGVRVAGIFLTIGALVALLWVRLIFARGSSSPFARPLVDLAIVAVVLTAIPILIVEGCSPPAA
jgi:hypothetical protein